MAIQLNPEDRGILERLLSRRRRPTSRQKAEALLSLAEGDAPEAVSRRVGMTRTELDHLVARFSERGLEGVGLGPSRDHGETGSRPRRYTSIEKTRGVCGGAVRVAGTRIPIWQLVEARDLGVSEAQLLLDFPGLTALNLVEAWRYAEEHPAEIAAQMH